MIRPLQLGIMISLTIAGLLLAYFYHIPLAFGFLLGLGSLIFFTTRAGTSWSTLGRSIKSGILHTKEVVWILLLGSLIIPAWTESGTIPYLIEQGLQLIDPTYLVTLSFLFCAVISMILGTSTGTLSAIGIPLIGMGAVLHIPLPLLAGALVSGVFVGDRTSPFSSAHQLLASSTGTTVRKQYPKLMPTTIAAVLCALVFYGISDLRGNWNAQHMTMPTTNFSAHFELSPWLLIPVIVLLGANAFRLKTKYAFLLSIAASIIIGTWLQQISLTEWLHTLWRGYQFEELPSLHTKGMLQMLDLVLLIALAGAYNGILEETGTLQPYMEKILGTSSSMAAGTVRAGLFGIILSLLSCTQTLPIMMTGRNLLPLWERRFAREHLSRVIADTALVAAAMVPWNLLAVLCGTIIGIPIASYVPYAIFLWSLPFLTVITSMVIDLTQKKRISATRQNENELSQ
ncbi:Na+/H+ antiporter NhaC family protein [Paenibacillus guangzhouensis]|uniref:Na+/H+ antiporter NhaC family protein n=1 Tax=Paenibacillus guangzhouensis TaxID=1473112 RepID=UPI0012677A3F|nr:Na+/H+ antiporter NhaC family protein [Paenibacillus guangzhouensis]